MDTWKNDDVISEAISFEFSLLKKEEKIESMAYFEKYNLLEDRVYWLEPGSDNAKSVSMGVSSGDKEKLAEAIYELSVQLNETAKTGLDLMALFMKGKIRDFPAFSQRLKNLAHEAKRFGIEEPCIVSKIED